MITLNFSPFPKLYTERLILRELTMEDDVAIFRMRSDDLVNKYLEHFRHDDIQQSRAFIEKIQKLVTTNESIFWVIETKDTHQFAGTICLWNIVKEADQGETGYALLPDFMGKGMMQEALAEVIRFGLEDIQLKTLEAYTHPENERSIQLLEKFHFNRKPLEERKHDGPEIIFVLKNR